MYVKITKHHQCPRWGTQLLTQCLTNGTSGGVNAPNGFLTSLSFSNILSIQFIQFFQTEMLMSLPGPFSLVCKAFHDVMLSGLISLPRLPSYAFHGLFLLMLISCHMYQSFHREHVFYIFSPENSYLSFIFTKDIICYFFSEVFTNIIHDLTPLPSG